MIVSVKWTYCNRKGKYHNGHYLQAKEQKYFLCYRWPWFISSCKFRHHLCSEISFPTCSLQRPMTIHSGTYQIINYNQPTLPFTIHASHISPYSLPLLLPKYSNSPPLYALITHNSWLVGLKELGLISLRILCCTFQTLVAVSQQIGSPRVFGPGGPNPLSRLGPTSAELVRFFSLPLLLCNCSLK